MAETITLKNLGEIEKVLILAIDNKINIKEAASELNKNESLIQKVVPRIHEAIANKLFTKASANKVFLLYKEYLGLVNSKQISLTQSTSKKSVITKPAPKKEFRKTLKIDEEYTEEELEDEKINSKFYYDEVGLSESEKAMIEYDATVDDDYEERSYGEILRGDEAFVDSTGRQNKKIIGYKYKIFIRDKKPLAGELSREEMDKIYRLYSNMDGAGLTLRSVSREFSFLNYKDFKRILRAFNITKASIPVAPHAIEEHSEEELSDIIFLNKENNLFKKMNDERSHRYEKEYFKTKKQIFDIKQESDWVEKIVDGYFKKHTPKLPKPVSRPLHNLGKSDKPLFCLFGDIHYGKKFTGTIFGREYNKEIAHDRVMQIAKKTIEEARVLKPKEIVVLSMGDLLECAMEDGMHPGHSMEMDLFQEHQIFFAADSMVEMLKTLIAETDCKITFCSIHGNHDRIGIKRDDDKSRTAGKIVTGMIKRMLANEKNLEVIMPENNLLKLVRGKICLFAHHGDSSLNKKKPSEIVNIWGEGTSFYHLLVKGHWHSLKADEGTNFLTLTTPSVASADKYILEELGNNNLPGFVLGYEPECYGFDYKKITLH